MAGADIFFLAFDANAFTGLLIRGVLGVATVIGCLKMTLQPAVQANVKRGSTIHTDELRSYRGLAKVGYHHVTINHGDG